MQKKLFKATIMDFEAFNVGDSNIGTQGFNSLQFYNGYSAVYKIIFSRMSFVFLGIYP